MLLASTDSFEPIAARQRMSATAAHALSGGLQKQPLVWWSTRDVWFVRHPMRHEESVPIVERFLTIEGHVSAQIRSGVAAGLPNPLPAHTALVFVGYAYADIPVGKVFDYLYDPSYVQQALALPSRIAAVTQQYGSAI